MRDIENKERTFLILRKLCCPDGTILRTSLRLNLTVILIFGGNQNNHYIDFISRRYYSLDMLTNEDLTKIKLIVTSGNSQVLKEIDEVKEKIENVESKIRFIPSKEEFSSAMSELIGEVKSTREEQTVISRSTF